LHPPPARSSRSRHAHPFLLTLSFRRVARWDRNRDGHLSLHELEKALAACADLSGGKAEPRTRAEVRAKAFLPCSPFRVCLEGRFALRAI
jgi:hypothetical protein